MDELLRKLQLFLLLFRAVRYIRSDSWWLMAFLVVKPSPRRRQMNIEAMIMLSQGQNRSTKFDVLSAWTQNGVDKWRGQNRHKEIDHLTDRTGHKCLRPKIKSQKHLAWRRRLQNTSNIACSTSANGASVRCMDAAWRGVEGSSTKQPRLYDCRRRFHVARTAKASAASHVDCEAIAARAASTAIVELRLLRG